MNTRNLTILSLLFLISISKGFSQKTISADKLAAINSVFEAYNDNPGCAIGIFHDGKIIFDKTYGYANMDYKIPISDRTVFDVGSVSKQFTAACIFLLEEQGQLSLEDEIQKYVPEIPKYAEGPIKIKHLLHHTSGLRSYQSLFYSKGNSWHDKYSNKDALKLLSKQLGLNSRPGDRFAYSNSGYFLLSIIVERVSGMSYREFVTENVFKPLGMNNTLVYDNHLEVVENRVIGYNIADGELHVDHYYDCMVTGDGGVYSTIEDMFKWSEQLKSNKIGGANFNKNMLTVGKLNDGTELDYAGGLFLGDYLPNFYSIGHDGEWAGSRALFMKFPEKDMTFVMMSNNASFQTWGHFRTLVNIIFEEELREDRNRVIAETTSSNDVVQGSISIPSHASDYTGLYYNYISGNSREIALLDDTLHYIRQPGSPSTKLLPIASDKFAFQGLPNVTIEFFQDKGNERGMRFRQGHIEILFTKYKPRSYTLEELKKFKGRYYSKELDVNYDLRVIENGLGIDIDGEEFEKVHAVMDNLFDTLHFGYLQFQEGGNGEIDAFTLNDELRSNILFTRVDKS